MYNAKYIVPGLVVFLAFATLPFWYNIASGSAGETFKIDPQAKPGTACVLDAENMREGHMKILNDWRNQVVREGKREFQTSDGRTFQMSLTKTCLECHGSKTEFCDKCHDYSGVDPNCWTCHVDPHAEAAKQ